MAMYAEMVRSFQSALIVVAHPDDADSLAAGTVAKLTRAGTRVAYCIATNGEKGSGDRTMTPERLGASHRDHRIVAQTALDCVTGLIGARLAFPELLAQGLEPHVVEEVRLMVWENPDLLVDISETIDLKIAALACHTSQMPDRVALDRNVRERAAQLGKP